MVELSFDDGVTGRAVGYAKNVLLAVGERAYPPGRPLEMTLHLEDAKPVVRGRSIGSKRREDGLFDLRIRLVDLRRDDRARLEAAVG